MKLAPETRGGLASWLEPVQELPETPVLELRLVSPVPDPAEPDDVPAVTSAPVTGPELEPARMASGLAVPEPAPEPTRPCAVSTHVVSGEKEPTILAFPHRLVAEQLTLMYAVSTAGSKWGWAFPVPWAAPDLLSPDVHSCDLGPHPSFLPCALRNSPHPQGFTDHRDSRAGI